MPIYHSPFTSPVENLAYEQEIFQNLPCSDRPSLLLWRNEPSVIIGRNQNPWRECRLKSMQHAGISFFRRKSGGGAVYHDLGNLNLTFFASRAAHDPSRNFRIVFHALRQLGIRAERNDHNDILVGGKKISGSAFRMERQHAYHHLTLLCAADLSALRRYLQSSSDAFTDIRGTLSKTSSVINIKELRPEIDIKDIMEALSTCFATELQDAERKAHSPSFALHKRVCAHFESWDWRYGNTPDFSLECRVRAAHAAGYRVHVHRARISGLFQEQGDLPCDSSLLGAPLPLSPTFIAHLPLRERGIAECIDAMLML